MSKERRIADLPEPEQAYLRTVYERAKARFEAVVASHGVKAGLARAIATERVAVLDEALAPVFHFMAQAETPVACAKGCSCCCTTTVPVSPDEIFALVEHLAATLSPEVWAAVEVRARANNALGHGVPSVERHQMRLFCPVLDPATGSCLGHGARPVACQGYLSLDLARCEADYADTPRQIPHPWAANLISRIVDDTRTEVLEAAGLKTAALELTAALVALCDDREAETRWLEGAAVLETAPYIPSRPEDIARMAKERGQDLE